MEAGSPVGIAIALLQGIVTVGGSRQVVAATANALFRVLRDDSRGPSDGLDEMSYDLAARLDAIKPVLLAQASGRSVPSCTKAFRNVAEHNFEVDFSLVDQQQAKSIQRSGRRRRGRNGQRGAVKAMASDTCVGSNHGMQGDWLRDHASTTSDNGSSASTKEPALPLPMVYDIGDRIADKAIQTEPEAANAAMPWGVSAQMAAQTDVSFPPCCFVAAGWQPVVGASMSKPVVCTTEVVPFVCKESQARHGLEAAGPFDGNHVPSVTRSMCSIKTSSNDALHLATEGPQLGAWFNEKWTEWRSTFQEWKQKQRDWKDLVRRTDHIDVDTRRHRRTEEYKLVPSSVKHVTGVVSGDAFFCEFAFEDWALLSVRYELFLLLCALGSDSSDPGPPNIPLEDLACCYNDHYQKQLEIHKYGFKEFSELAAIIPDTVVIKGGKVYLVPHLCASTELEHFIQLAAAHRRDRLRRVDAGDELALLKFVR